MPTESTRAAGARRSVAHSFSWPIVLLVAGPLLIASSFLPLGSAATKSLWTAEDAIAYDRLSLEYHRSAYESAARAGLTEEELSAKQKELRRRFEAMRGKLEHARQQPQLWRRYLLGGGALVSALGAIGYARQR